MEPSPRVWIMSDPGYSLFWAPQWLTGPASDILYVFTLIPLQSTLYGALNDHKILYHIEIDRISVSAQSTEVSHSALISSSTSSTGGPREGELHWAQYKTSSCILNPLNLQAGFGSCMQPGCTWHISRRGDMRSWALLLEGLGLSDRRLL